MRGDGLEVNDAQNGFYVKQKMSWGTEDVVVGLLGMGENCLGVGDRLKVLVYEEGRLTMADEYIFVVGKKYYGVYGLVG